MLTFITLRTFFHCCRFSELWRCGRIMPWHGDVSVSYFSLNHFWILISLTIAVELGRWIFMGYLKLFCTDAGKGCSLTPWLWYITISHLSRQHYWGIVTEFNLERVNMRLTVNIKMQFPPILPLYSVYWKNNKRFAQFTSSLWKVLVAKGRIYMCSHVDYSDIKNFILCGGGWGKLVYELGRSCTEHQISLPCVSPEWLSASALILKNGDFGTFLLCLCVQDLTKGKHGIYFFQ